MQKGVKRMGRVKDWMIEMEEDASDMTLSEWTEKHGEANVNVYEAVRREADYFDADGIFRVADNPATTISTMERDRISKLCAELNGIEGPDAQLESVLRQAQEELQLLLSKIKTRKPIKEEENDK
tara:strand:+ start:101 stop:475 length:375 start_codon:yes stop_codon:yes gene_type:complete